MIVASSSKKTTGIHNWVTTEAEQLLVMKKQQSSDILAKMATDIATETRKMPVSLKYCLSQRDMDRSSDTFQYLQAKIHCASQNRKLATQLITSLPCLQFSRYDQVRSFLSQKNTQFESTIAVIEEAQNAMNRLESAMTKGSLEVKRVLVRRMTHMPMRTEQNPIDMRLLLSQRASVSFIPVVLNIFLYI